MGGRYKEMSDKICTTVNLYKRGRLEQGYSLYGDKAKVTLQSRGFSIVVEMQDNSDEGRAQASVKVCGHEIFNTEDHVLKEPKTMDMRIGEGHITYAIVKEARASVALDGQTQSLEKKGG